jgi:hypothetical protein
LANFGQIWLCNRYEIWGVKKKPESFYVLGYLLVELIIKNLAIFGIIFLQNLTNLGYFFLHEKSFV